MGVHINGHKLRYLRPLTTEENNIKENKARAAEVYEIYKGLKFELISRAAKFIIYKTIIRPVDMYVRVLCDDQEG